MGLEIERKYRVINDNWKSAVQSESALKQGYLVAQPGVTIRVRIAGERARLNIKGGLSGISRSEYEYEIPLADAQEIIANLTTGSLIDKTRYKVRCGGHVWDLDVFHGDNAGLVIAEIELQSETESFQLPDWAGDEVSHDARYFNANLIKHPYRDW